jgi:hypothetical protein
MSAAVERQAPPGCQLKGRQSAVAFNVELSGLLMLPPACETLRALLKSDMDRALTAHNLLLTGEPDAARNFKPRATSHLAAYGNYFYGVFCVSDWLQGLAVMEEELKRTGLFADAETGWYCKDELIWRRHHPSNDASPFIAKLFETNKYLVNTKLVQTLGWITGQRQPPKQP